jgi:hypothetical protein
MTIISEDKQWKELKSQVSHVAVSGHTANLHRPHGTLHTTRVNTTRFQSAAVLQLNDPVKLFSVQHTCQE